MNETNETEKQGQDDVALENARADFANKHSLNMHKRKENPDNGTIQQ